jgi:cytochrome c oxidase subunit 2
MRCRLPLVAPLALLAGCQNAQSALDTHGPSARSLGDLIWLFTGVVTVVWLLVVLVLLLALARGSRDRNASSGSSDERMKPVVIGATLATALVVAGLTVASYLTTRAIGEPQEAEIEITVRGQQWWWQFIYVDPVAGRFETANELHIPVGKPVRLRLESPDVIHSFWVPSLAGKMDLIPGRTNVLTVRADRPGTYRGQCAEYCGIQHSHMSLFVNAESDADYARWAALQKADANAPVGEEAIAGRDVFLRKPCAACHTVRGTPATGKTGPDLTHVGGRVTIAAGTLDNTRGGMAAWLADPQTVKPGNNMPLVTLSSDELRQISAYMESLK